AAAVPRARGGHVQDHIVTTATDIRDAEKLTARGKERTFRLSHEETTNRVAPVALNDRKRLAGRRSRAEMQIQVTTGAQAYGARCQYIELVIVASGGCAVDVN